MMKEKCIFYARGTCFKTKDCVFKYFHHTKPQCKKGGLLNTPKNLKYLEVENEK